MGKKINFPGANEHQNKILNMIAEQKAAEAKAEQDAFDKEKDKEQFLFLWKHFDDRLGKILADFRDTHYQTGIHSLEVHVKIKKKDSTDAIQENFVYSDKLKLTKYTEIE